METTATSFEANRRATSAVRSLDPSSTTMISLRGQVWAIADWIVSAIHSSALYAGMRIETSGFMMRTGFRRNGERVPSAYAHSIKLLVPKDLLDFGPSTAFHAVLRDEGPQNRAPFSLVPDNVPDCGLGHKSLAPTPAPQPWCANTHSKPNR